MGGLGDRSRLEKCPTNLWCPKGKFSLLFQGLIFRSMFILFVCESASLILIFYLEWWLFYLQLGTLDVGNMLIREVVLLYPNGLVAVGFGAVGKSCVAATLIWHFIISGIKLDSKWFFRLYEYITSKNLYEPDNE